MGNSRAIFVALLSVIFGAYTASFTSTDRLHARIGIVRTHNTSAELIAKAGAGIALNAYVRAGDVLTVSPVTRSLMGGSVTFKADPLSSTRTKITSTAVAGNQIATHVTIAERVSSYRFREVSSYTALEVPNYSDPLPTD